MREFLLHQCIIAVGGGCGRGGRGAGAAQIETYKVPYFPFVPWTRGSRNNRGTSNGKVAVAMLLDGEGPDASILDGLESSSLSRGVTDTLQDIMDSPPLLEAFKEFCQRALCSEVGRWWDLFFTQRKNASGFERGVCY